MKTIYGKVEAGTQTMQATGGGIDEIQTDLARFQVVAIRQLGRASTRSRQPPNRRSSTPLHCSRGVVTRLAAPMQVPLCSATKPHEALLDQYF